MSDIPMQTRGRDLTGTSMVMGEGVPVEVPLSPLPPRGYLVAMGRGGGATGSLLHYMLILGAIVWRVPLVE